MKFGSAQAGFGNLFADVDRAETLARRKVRCGFVSTNSITQGEPVIADVSNTSTPIWWRRAMW
ncbi:MAG: hypothetical protein KJ614_13240 [Gammaproteobacteria bacterium]|uniref:hypothetical protein n=1 Tax=Rhodoferax sp. TaxID=50421 RepID=UPI00181E6A4F|nr:hypothetical protein [Rhodoferax sp.]MBU3899867.1 hypothetical protein [Gammaproteobacteria bacterium]MBA3058623.1 hypothetical protein [Rhodoferax sp.]MBU3996050.1 hypothetical protein [Gammaproteobacteria bacterium]MBU4019132.1 hypothetical protein [Gammaproteobacteria bacterium]MBU4078850.1 hypothetical protein [Gammaproteobacteria bacterium]